MPQIGEKRFSKVPEEIELFSADEAGFIFAKCN